MLILEDNPNDAELMLRELRQSGFTLRARRVQNQHEYVSALDAGFAPGQPWDVILADFTLPGFSGRRALQLLRERGSDVPFIVISGSIGEDLAVQATQEGATDYLLKDRLTRLGSSVTRALEEHRLRQSQRQAEDNYYHLFENSLAGIYQTTPDGQLLTANPALARLLGYDSPTDLIASLSDLARQSYVDPGHRAEFIRQMVENNFIAGFESELYRKDGSTIWVSENARAVRDAHETLLYYEGSIEDITARKLSDEALRASEERYRLLFEANPLPMWVYDLQTLGFVAVNDAALKHYGYGREEFLAMTIKDIRPPEEVHKLDKYRSIGPQPRETSGHWVHRKKDGARIAVEIISHDIVFSGRPGRLVLANDVTEKLAAEQALRNSEQRYKSLFQDSPIPLWEEDYSLVRQRLESLRQQGVADYRAYFASHPDVVAECASSIRIVDVNKAALTRNQALSKDELLQGPGQVFGPPIGTEFLEELVKVAEGRLDFQWEGISRTTAGDQIISTKHWLVVPGYEQTLARVMFSAVDITDQKQAEEALRRSEERYRIVSELASDFAYAVRVEPNGALVQEWVTEAFTRVTGFVMSEVDLAGGWPSILHPDDTPAFLRRVQSLLSGQPDVTEYRAFTKSGDIRWLRDSGRPVWDDGEKRVIRIYGAAQDITESKRAEDVVAQSERHFRALIENSSDGIALITPDGTVLYASPAAARIVGGTPDDWLGGNFLNRVHPEDAPRLASLLAELLQTPGASLASEFRYRRSDESWCWLEATATNMLAEPAVNAIVANYRDITDRRRAEAAVRQSQNDLETAQALAHLGSWTRDARSDLTLWSKEMFRLHNLSLAEAAPSFEAYIETVHPDDRATLIGHIQALEEKVDQATCVYRTNPTLGPERLLEVQLHAVRVDSGQAPGWHGTVQDVTQRKQHERELEAVAAVSAGLRTAQTLDEMLPIWLDITLAVMQATGGSIWLYDSSKAELHPAVIRGWSQPAGAGPVSPQKPGAGVNGYVFATGQPYVSTNFQVDPLLAEGTRDRIPPGGGVGIPIRVGDLVIGTFIVNVPLGREITPEEVHLLTTLAEIAGSAIQRARLSQQTEQRLSQLSALRAIDQAISASMDLHVTLSVFLDQVIAQLGVDAADVLLLDPQDQTLSYAAGRGFRTLGLRQAGMSIGDGRAGRVVRERQIVVSDLQDDRAASKRTGLLARDNFVSYIGVPLIAKGLVLGALEIFHRRRLDPAPEWLEFLSALAGQAAIALDNAALFNNLQRSNMDLQLAYDATIEGWSRALDLRDRETEGHSRRVTKLTEQLAAEMGVPEQELVHVRRGALLHDIGKMGVPDHILLKPGPLTDEEWTKMIQHPVFAYEMLSPIHYLRPALDIPYCHHEKWDGTGYPRGLKGLEIPIAARLFAVVDVWDALRSDRPYRPAWPHEKVREHLRSLAGTHFDPQVVETFLRMLSPTATPGDI